MKTQNAACGVLPIHSTQLSRGLVRLYQRLAGELAKAETREKTFLSSDQAQAGMQQVAGLLELLGVNSHPRCSSRFGRVPIVAYWREVRSGSE